MIHLKYVCVKTLQIEWLKTYMMQINPLCCHHSKEPSHHFFSMVNLNITVQLILSVWTPQTLLLTVSNVPLAPESKFI